MPNITLGSYMKTGMGFRKIPKKRRAGIAGLPTRGTRVPSTTLGSCTPGRGVPQDFKEALRWFRLAAEQGDPAAQFNLGLMYDEGTGIPQDFKEAARWYRRAAEQGDADARFNLGFMYSKGEGVPQDYKEALRWYRLAADQGDADAQFNLGVTYYKGRGIPQDFVQAHKWLNLAAAKGDKESSDARERVAQKITKSQIEEAQRLAREWKPKK
jgi:TPR repeat protein